MASAGGASETGSTGTQSPPAGVWPGTSSAEMRMSREVSELETTRPLGYRSASSEVLGSNSPKAVATGNSRASGIEPPPQEAAAARPASPRGGFPKRKLSGRVAGGAGGSCGGLASAQPQGPASHGSLSQHTAGAAEAAAAPRDRRVSDASSRAPLGAVYKEVLDEVDNITEVTTETVQTPDPGRQHTYYQDWGSVHTHHTATENGSMSSPFAGLPRVRSEVWGTEEERKEQSMRVRPRPRFPPRSDSGSSSLASASGVRDRGRRESNAAAEGSTRTMTTLAESTPGGGSNPAPGEGTSGTSPATGALRVATLPMNPPAPPPGVLRDRINELNAPGETGEEAGGADGDAHSERRGLKGEPLTARTDSTSTAAALAIDDSRLIAGALQPSRERSPSNGSAAARSWPTLTPRRVVDHDDGASSAASPDALSESTASPQSQHSSPTRGRKQRGLLKKEVGGRHGSGVFASNSLSATAPGATTPRTLSVSSSTPRNRRGTRGSNARDAHRHVSRGAKQLHIDTSEDLLRTASAANERREGRRRGSSVLEGADTKTTGGLASSDSSPLADGGPLTIQVTRVKTPGSRMSAPPSITQESSFVSTEPAMTPLVMSGDVTPAVEDGPTRFPEAGSGQLHFDHHDGAESVSPPTSFYLPNDAVTHLALVSPATTDVAENLSPGIGEVLTPDDGGHLSPASAIRIQSDLSIVMSEKRRSGHALDIDRATSLSSVISADTVPMDGRRTSGNDHHAASPLAALTKDPKLCGFGGVVAAPKALRPKRMGDLHVDTQASVQTTPAGTPVEREERRDSATGATLPSGFAAEPWDPVQERLRRSTGSTGGATDVRSGASQNTTPQSSPRMELGNRAGRGDDASPIAGQLRRRKLAEGHTEQDPAPKPSASSSPAAEGKTAHGDGGSSRTGDKEKDKAGEKEWSGLGRRRSVGDTVVNACGAERESLPDGERMVLNNKHPDGSSTTLWVASTPASLNDSPIRMSDAGGARAGAAADAGSGATDGTARSGNLSDTAPGAATKSSPSLTYASARGMSAGKAEGQAPSPQHPSGGRAGGAAGDDGDVNHPAPSSLDDPAATRNASGGADRSYGSQEVSPVQSPPYQIMKVQSLIVADDFKIASSAVGRGGGSGAPAMQTPRAGGAGASGEREARLRELQRRVESPQAAESRSTSPQSVASPHGRRGTAIDMVSPTPAKPGGGQDAQRSTSDKAPQGSAGAGDDGGKQQGMPPKGGGGTTPKHADTLSRTQGTSRVDRAPRATPPQLQTTNLAGSSMTSPRTGSSPLSPVIQLPASSSGRQLSTNTAGTPVARASMSGLTNETVSPMNRRRHSTQQTSNNGGRQKLTERGQSLVREHGGLTITSPMESPSEPGLGSARMTSPTPSSVATTTHGDSSFRETPRNRSRYASSPRSKQANQPRKWKRGKELGQGGFGTVYVGLEDGGQMIAVKHVKLNPQDETSVFAMRALLREVNLMNKLKHKNIVQYYGMEQQDTYVNIFMEYVPGGSILAVLHEFGPFPDEVTSNYARQIIEGLNYLHSKNVVHRDIKAANILLHSDGDLRLADFGAAMQQAKSTKQDRLQGSILWMAPEILTLGKDAAIEKNQDIWSLGCTLLEMLTAEPPFRWIHDDTLEVVRHISDVEKPVALPPKEISKDATEFLKTCLKKHAGERPTAADLLSIRYIKKSEGKSLENKSSMELSSMSPKKKPTFSRSWKEDNSLQSPRASAVLSPAGVGKDGMAVMSGVPGSSRGQAQRGGTSASGTPRPTSRSARAEQLESYATRNTENRAGEDGGGTGGGKEMAPFGGKPTISIPQTPTGDPSRGQSRPSLSLDPAKFSRVSSGNFDNATSTVGDTPRSTLTSPAISSTKKQRPVDGRQGFWGDGPAHLSRSSGVAATPTSGGAPRDVLSSTLYSEADDAATDNTSGLPSSTHAKAMAQHKALVSRRQFGSLVKFECLKHKSSPSGIVLSEKSPFYVDRIEQSSPADDVGLRLVQGWTLTRVNSVPATNYADVSQMLYDEPRLVLTFMQYRLKDELEVLRSNKEWHRCTVIAIDVTERKVVVKGPQGKGAVFQKDILFPAVENALRYPTPSPAESAKVATPLAQPENEKDKEKGDHAPHDRSAKGDGRDASAKDLDRDVRRRNGSAIDRDDRRASDAPQTSRTVSVASATSLANKGGLVAQAAKLDITRIHQAFVKNKAKDDQETDKWCSPRFSPVASSSSFSLELASRRDLAQDTGPPQVVLVVLAATFAAHAIGARGGVARTPGSPNASGWARRPSQATTNTSVGTPAGTPLPSLALRPILSAAMNIQAGNQPSSPDFRAVTSPAAAAGGGQVQADAAVPGAQAPSPSRNHGQGEPKLLKGSHRRQRAHTLESHKKIAPPWPTPRQWGTRRSGGRDAVATPSATRGGPIRVETPTEVETPAGLRLTSGTLSNYQPALPQSAVNNGSIDSSGYVSHRSGSALSQLGRSHDASQVSPAPEVPLGLPNGMLYNKRMSTYGNEGDVAVAECMHREETTRAEMERLQHQDFLRCVRALNKAAGTMNISLLVGALRTRVALDTIIQNDSARSRVIHGAIATAAQSVPTEIITTVTASEWTRASLAATTLSSVQAADLSHDLMTAFDIAKPLTFMPDAVPGDAHRDFGITFRYLPGHGFSGFVVEAVAADSPAEAVKIRRGLELLCIEGQQAASEDGLHALLQAAQEREKPVFCFFNGSAEDSHVKMHDRLSVASPRAKTPPETPDTHAATPHTMNPASDLEPGTAVSQHSYRTGIRLKLRPANFLIMLLIIALTVVLAIFIDGYLLLLLLLLPLSCAFS